VDWLDSQFIPTAKKREIRTAQAAWKRLVRGYQLYADQDYSAALQILNEAVFLDPSLIEAYKWIGCIAAIQGKSIKASEAFIKVIRSEPDFELTGEIPTQVHQLFNRLKGDK
jgi:Tfp pilus assembly protein PilF